MAVPGLAIIIPVYNEAKILPHALKSLHGLSVDELFFVDGGSNDGSRGLIAASGYSCLHSEPGRAKQMNIGAKNTKSEIILFLHVDTLISSSQISNIKKTYNQGFLGGRFDIRFTDDGLRYRILSFFINMRSRLSKVSTGDQAMFVRRDVFEQLQGFKEMPLMEDIEFSKRLRKLGPVACLKERVATSNRRWEKHGFCKTVVLMWKLRLLYWLGVSPDKLAAMYGK